MAALAAGAGTPVETFVADLVDPGRYTGLAGRLVDDAVVPESRRPRDDGDDAADTKENA